MRRGAPPLMRQVQIAVGSPVLAGVLLVAPVLHGLAGFVGTRLVFAGVPGFRGMAKTPALMAWNCRVA